ELEVAEYESTMAVLLECTINFLQILRHLKKLLFIGSVVCLDSFLHVFTILPAQIVMALRTLSTVKVYVIFNMLEVFNWLCSVFWRGILDALPSEASFFLHHAYNYVQPTSISPVTPNMIINLYIYSLPTLLLSNQFADIKSNLFKRFQTVVSLTIIALKNGIELSAGSLAQMPSAADVLIVSTS
ncbi:hypothetical protein H4R35_005047, partial [Dimargaris xerosporica]